ncbi:NADH dehydrogenase [ubiquinone] 1 alpha subcomplex assembly factor 3-like [Impatiens glandulifera]|uniref:NADH dehydrogenase [ubiquinone] 1 alpha subcomplex assembly factor 3-like n=1 Tax=Impatiens glandulifera TaxID=253017 RepID=UPI001FB17235|nr:NADH dehydrogenase [ubiquinone] 1 alpha subcomplex assembly factor 3-like [Impatiens glandulifera]
MTVRQKTVATLPTLLRSLRNRTAKSSSQKLPSLRRAYSLYDQVNLIKNVPEDQLRIQEYSEDGFTVNGVEYEGSILCVGNLITSWSPKTILDINQDSLSIFQIMRPIPEILILGCGRYTQPIHPELRRFIRSTGMKLEAVDSRNAASTYNILNEEGRIVAAALLPFGVSS